MQHNTVCRTLKEYLFLSIIELSVDFTGGEPEKGTELRWKLLQQTSTGKTHFKKRIDLPPTHKPPPSYEERALSVSQKEVILQRERFPLQSQYREREAGNLQNIKAVNGRQLNYEDENPLGQENLQQMYPVHKQICYKDWSSKYHQNPGSGRIYINPREHYV
ncbi:poliovirus receptor-related 3 [Platysternon megacephalum]|uniref:Poliovirus receptor-related 3 n=1 Tax=Platysternon megacephalum TaxID=55544 RepID=A0A4D9DQ09_9SAUR|nr:poliovirus receptor-related 3 [Platysternon megacephalum]